MKHIGIVGLGVMGAGIAHNLLARGFDLSVFARDTAKAQPFVERGARLAATAADLGACDTVVLSVPATADVEAVLFGPQGIASRPGALRCVIDTSTIAAQASRGFAHRLAAQGIAFLDAPVSGGGKGAQEGTLACMVGGTQQAFDEALPVLQAFARSITRVGDSGAGQICKACNQVCVIANLLGAAEMVAICRANGIDPMVVREVVLAGTGRSVAMENHALRLIQGSFTPAGFRAELLLKDLRLARDLEQASGLPAPVMAAAEPLFARMVEELGQGALDWTAVGRLIQRS
jgi:2-hydroxy-3-oxopropionate reductase